jgi:hypothetical protein
MRIIRRAPNLMLENSLLSWTIRLFVGSLTLMSNVEAQEKAVSTSFVYCLTLRSTI